MTTQTAEQAREGVGKKAAQAEAPKWPEQIFQKLREANISQMVYVPDAGHAKLIELCHQANDIKTTVLTTEEEGIGVLAGAIVYEINEPDMAGPAVEAAGRIAFNGGTTVAVLLSQRMLGTKLFKD